jgi:hypothetical protein
MAWSFLNQGIKVPPELSLSHPDVWLGRAFSQHVDRKQKAKAADPCPGLKALLSSSTHHLDASTPSYTLCSCPSAGQPCLSPTYLGITVMISDSIQPMEKDRRRMGEDHR